jgi:hypothetical protein
MRTSPVSALAALLIGAAPAGLVGVAPAAAAPWSPPGTFPTSVGATPLLAEGSSGPRAVYWNSYGPGLPLPPSPATAAVSTLGPGLLP